MTSFNQLARTITVEGQRIKALKNGPLIRVSKRDGNLLRTGALVSIDECVYVCLCVDETQPGWITAQLRQVIT
jgi:hypothetical protein